jgi:hypothetical protein
MYTTRVNAGPKERMEEKENLRKKTQANYQGRRVNIETRTSLPNHACKKKMERPKYNAMPQSRATIAQTKKEYD